jgi:cell division protein FtsB
MLEKTLSTVTHFVRRLSDLRFLGQVIFVIIVILVSWSTAKAIQSNYDLQKQVASKQKENQLQQLRNDNLKIKNQYLETDEYLEITARRQLGKAAPGETVVIIPKAVAMRYTVESSIKSDEEVQKAADENKPFYQKNLEAWGDFFFRR